jgi:hypothetical protein
MTHTAKLVSRYRLIERTRRRHHHELLYESVPLVYLNRSDLLTSPAYLRSPTSWPSPSVQQG